MPTGRDGDPRFLATALQALKETRELLTLVGRPAATPVAASGDPWEPMREALKSLTAEELKVLDKLSNMRALPEPALGDWTSERDVIRAMREVATSQSDGADPTATSSHRLDDPAIE